MTKMSFRHAVSTRPPPPPHQKYIYSLFALAFRANALLKISIASVQKIFLDAILCPCKIYSIINIFSNKL